MPKEKDKILWKYFDIFKFLDFLNGNIYFCRADTLAKVDLFEGAFLNKAISEPSYNDETVNYISSDEISEYYKQLEDENKKRIAISCWHLSKFESVAMWNIYSKSGYGIAVKTTRDKIIQCLQNSAYHITHGPVKYIDFQRENAKYIMEDVLNHPWIPFTYKRKAFEYEKEYRFCLFKNPVPIILVNDNVDPYDQYIDANGVKIHFNNINEVIEEIIISPYLSEWESDILVDLITNKLKLNTKCTKSNLAKRQSY